MLSVLSLRRWRAAAAVALATTVAGLLAACTAPTTAPPVDITRQARPQAAATAHPLASQAALQVLAEGGGVVDAAIAAQMVLGLVEPQSSGIGGGTLLMVWDDAAGRLRAYDGLAAAPARATAGLRTDVDGRPLPAQDVARSGRAVGVPGTLAVLELAHRSHGRLPWARLFEPAIRLAEQGYPMAPYVHDILSRDPGGRQHPALRSRLFDAAGQAWPAGTLLRHDGYARTLRQLAGQGVAGYWRGGGAARLVAAVRAAPPAGLIEEDDLLRYRAVEREPLCVDWAAGPARRVCAFGPPSFGGISALQILQMVGAPAGAMALDDSAFWHRYAEAGKLAMADRRRFVGDPDHVDVPAHALVAPAYVASRAARIDPQRAAPRVEPGQPVPARSAAAPTDGDARDGHADATSQLVIADARGDVLSMTTTINLNFGSRLTVDGYVLNNAMTNFSPEPAMGQTSANQMAPGKRPVTSMSPVMAFDATGRPVVAGGSAGGGQIVDYIARNLIELLWLDRTPADTLPGGHVTTALAPRVQLEAGTPRAALADALRARGHEVVVERTLSGAAFLRRSGNGWVGAADPRRDGVALGR